MGILSGRRISNLPPEELLGRPLNDVENKYAPNELYVAGSMEIPIPSPRVAIVGRRKASPDGLKTARDIACTLAKNNIVIMGGLAEGIDTAAHLGAMESGGQTIAVIGTPLDRVYPAKNYELQQAIMDRHLVVTQFPRGYPITPKNFVIRNRTMALLCNASIIVEAGNTSGTLSQGSEALRLGRPLFIWKSIFDDPSLSWPTQMVKYGAVELTDLAQVFEILPSHESILEIIQ